VTHYCDLKLGQMNVHILTHFLLIVQRSLQ